MEFHISKNAREKYKFDMSLFETNGNVVIGNIHASRLLAASINKQKDLLNYPETAVKASELYAIGLMDEIFHYIFKTYRNQIQQDILKEALIFVENNLAPEENKKVIEFFLKEFPPLAVYLQITDLDEYLKQLKTDQTYSLILEEIIMLWVENQNPALENYRELFRDKELDGNTLYKKFIDLLKGFFDQKPYFGPENQNIIDMLRAPAVKVPHSIPGQLEYIRTHWSFFLGDFLYRLLNSLDFINEEQKATFGGPGPSIVPGYNQTWDLDYENFSPDKEWMPNLVLIAKNTYVWLDQIRKKYKSSITTIDQIPDEELDMLRDRGFNGLWLIGIWERSKASAQIKQLCGNPEAIASAYSLAGYQIATELGGESAYQILKERAWQRGIRLAADMVPNHMGIDSNWVYEHPDWFVQLNYSPFPSYSFNGANLSKYPNIEVKIEDHYYDRSDAAVVFQFKNQNSGETRFIYHGNDGTTMPWNDTAQLNYLIPEVREAVYQAILSVARRFPIIRFDAAMTLAKKHFQRLWFPDPGSGGAIPSRAEFGLSKDDFDRIMPTEFWRDVVDRLAADAPDTLLLAEAFWLMESYFVRTLGMHRVYNSAFMHMLRNEDNANYRLLVKNTIEFDPQILKRFVNFMNNPDEQTAVEQFGKGDKYFGICTLMSTLPGLPMFGHGQVEGFSEKYGMEYQRAYYNELPNQWLVNRHENEIFPLMKKRYLFSEIKNFWIYDLLDHFENINENIFAFTNSVRDEKALILFNNKYDTASGKIKYSTKKLVSDGNNKNLVTISLAEALGIKNDNKIYYIVTETISRLEYLFNGAQLHRDGFGITLEGFKSRVYLNFKEVYDEKGEYENLFNSLNGNGLDNVEIKLKENILIPVHQSVDEFFNEKRKEIIKNLFDIKEIALPANDIEYLKLGYFAFLKSVEAHLGLQSDDEKLETMFDEYLSTFLGIKKLLEKSLSKKLNGFNNELHSSVMFFNNVLEPDNYLISSFWVLISSMNKLLPENEKETLIDSLMIEKPIKKLLQKTGKSEYDLVTDFALINILNEELENIFELQELRESKNCINNIIAERVIKMLENKFVKKFLRPNIYQRKTYYRKESFEELIYWIFSKKLFEIYKINKVVNMKELEAMLRVIEELVEYSTFSGYQLEVLETNLKANINETKMRSM